jgi:hypothetical protein
MRRLGRGLVLTVCLLAILVGSLGLPGSAVSARELQSSQYDPCAYAAYSPLFVTLCLMQIWWEQGGSAWPFWWD